MRSLAERARSELEVRVRELLDEERARYLDLLDSLGIEPGAGRPAAQRGAGASTTSATPRPGGRDGGPTDRPLGSAETYSVRS